MSSVPAILEIEGVRPTTPSPPRTISLRLRPGEWARLTAREADLIPLWGDLLIGLAEPAAGAVRVLGRPWNSAGPEEQSAWRADIGRVFARTAWLANLDVDENVLLAALYHTRQSAAEWRRLAMELAQRFGLPDLPGGRPAHASADALQRAQWVRALLRAPRLLILERPLVATPPAAATSFGEALEDALGRGAAMVWLGLEGDPPPPPTLRPPAAEATI